MTTVLDLVKPKPEARWVVFYSLDGPDGGLYYDAHPIEQMRYRLTMLAYDMNGEPLSYGHGAPLRATRCNTASSRSNGLPASTSWPTSARSAAAMAAYNADHEFFGYHHSI